jgi:iron-sulfur cluster repair protein YtfE (RIC family)
MQMSMTAEKTVRELALENPAATRVFEKLGIDYCCGGNKSLNEACRAQSCLDVQGAHQYRRRLSFSSGSTTVVPG